MNGAARAGVIDRVPLCPTCHWWELRDVRVAGSRQVSGTCTQGCPRANTAEKWNCKRYQREPGTDD
jgi:hypothetical protein